MSEEEKEEAQDTEDEGVVIEVESTEVESDSEPERVEKKSKEPETGDEELESYGNKVQIRIKKLTEKYRKEERDRSEAQRLARELLDENNKLKSQVKNLDKGYVASEENRVIAQNESAKRQFREAHESGDADALIAAQELLSKTTLDKERVRMAKNRLERPAAPQQQQQQQQQQPPQAQAAAQPDPQAESWATKNEWFGSDNTMTYAAFGIHKKLVEEEGFDPQSEDYYSEVDKRIRTEFPHKFPKAKKSGEAQVAPAGASASRTSTKQGRRSVKLSPSQIAMAKRLNVPLEEYAKFVKD